MANIKAAFCTSNDSFFVILIEWAKVEGRTISCLAGNPIGKLGHAIQFTAGFFGIKCITVFELDNQGIMIRVVKYSYMKLTKNDQILEGQVEGEYPGDSTSCRQSVVWSFILYA